MQNALVQGPHDPPPGDVSASVASSIGWQPMMRQYDVLVDGDDGIISGARWNMNG